jgi:hypothetical protein
METYLMADDVDEDVKELELKEERRAAEGQARKLNVEVTELPKVNRNQNGAVTSVLVKAKAPFKGEVTLRMRGDVASAFWSVTPGMKLSARVFERDDKDYEVDTIDIVNRG